MAQRAHGQGERERDLVVGLGGERLDPAGGVGVGGLDDAGGVEATEHAGQRPARSAGRCGSSVSNGSIIRVALQQVAEVGDEGRRR